MPEVASKGWLFVIFIRVIFCKKRLQLEIDRCSPSVDSFRNGGLETLCETFLPTAQVLCLEANYGHLMPCFFIEDGPATEANPGMANYAF